MLLVLASAAATAACRRDAAQGSRESDAFDGIVELELQRLGFEVGGRVASVAVDRGSDVDSDTVLVQLDGRMAELSRAMRAAELTATEARLAILRAGSRKEDLDALNAQLQAARKTVALLKSNKELATKSNLAESSVDDISMQLHRAEAEQRVLQDRLVTLRAGARPEEVDAAAAQVEAATDALALEDERLAALALRAPSAGTVIDVLVRPGGIVAPAMPVVVLADTRRPYVDVFVPQDRLTGIAVGTPASVRVDAENSTFDGAVESIATRLEFTPRFLFSPGERPNLVLRVRVRVDDPDERLHAGAPAFVTFDETA